MTRIFAAIILTMMVVAPAQAAGHAKHRHLPVDHPKLVVGHWKYP